LDIIDYKERLMSTSTSANQATEVHPTVGNAVKLVGEAFVPGASLLMDGKILAGGAHLLIGTWAKLAFGPIGLALVVANSYSTSSTGKSLIKQFTKDEPKSGTAHKAST
jgi:hypothetical protein